MPKKNVIFFAAALFLLFNGVLLFTGEQLFRGYISKRTPGLTARELAEERRTYLDENSNPLESVKRGRRFESKFQLHPYFGYVYNAHLKGINSFGFNTRYDFDLCGGRYCLKDAGLKNPLVIGIFGGSVAENTAANYAYLEKKLKAVFPERTPVVINFGVGGHALPQAYYIFSYFAEMLDAAVFLDGLNELWNPVVNNKSGVPPEFAKAHHFRHKLSLNELTPENFRLTDEILKAKERMLSFTGFSLLPVIERSMIIHYLWEAARKFEEQEAQKKMAELAANYSGGSPFFDVPEEKIFQLAAAKWESYHRRIHQLGEAEKIFTVHLLQPNPYVEGSKPLTGAEKERMRVTYPVEVYVTKGYPLLLSRLSALRQDGLIAEDLLYIFQDLTEDIWVDSAHTNTRGSHLILDRMAEILGNHSGEIKGRTESGRL